MFKVNRNTDTVKDYEGGGNDYLSKSGIYKDVTIKAIIYDEAANGGAVVNFFVEHNGVEQTIYGQTRVYNIGGKDNAIGQETINELMIVLGLDALGDVEEADLPIGKGGAMKTVTIYPEGQDELVDIKITNEYDTYNNDIKEKTVITKFYRNSDKATAAEIVLEDENPGEVELGSKYGKDLEYADNVKYKNGITPEQVTAWIAAKRPKGTAGVSAGASKKPSFNKPKKKFGK